MINLFIFILRELNNRNLINILEAITLIVADYLNRLNLKIKLISFAIDFKSKLLTKHIDYI